MTGSFWLVVVAWFIMACAWADVLCVGLSWRKVAYRLKDIVEKEMKIRVSLHE